MTNNAPSRDFNFKQAIESGDAAALQAQLAKLAMPEGKERTEFLTEQLVSACCMAFNNKYSFEIIDALIDAGAQVNMHTKNRSSPFGVVCQGDDVDLLKHLIVRGADVNADVNADQSGASKPLHFACTYSDNPSIVEELLKNGADPNAKGFYGYTPLHRAVEVSANAGAVSILLAAGSNVNARSDHKETPLIRAISAFTDPQTVKTLLEKGADCSVRDKRGRTPLHEAAKGGCHELVALLIQAGASALSEDEDGKTPRQTSVETRQRMRNEPTAIEIKRLCGDRIDYLKTWDLLKEAEKNPPPGPVRKFFRKKFGI